MRARIQHFFPSILLLPLISALGAGCLPPSFQIPSTLQQESKPNGQKQSTFEALTPQQAAQKINLVSGSIVVMRQGFSGIVGTVAKKLGFGGGEGTRTIVIKRFAPGHSAEIEWTLTTKGEKKDEKDSGVKRISGSLAGIDLLRSHTLYLPGYWQEGERNAFGTSALWLGEIVYEDLSKLKSTTLNFGILDQELYSGLKIAKDIQTALQQLKIKVDNISERTDVYYMTADAEPSDWQLSVNGTNVTVQVLKARNWFGEIVVLNNKQNPLVLKVTLNPLALAAIDATIGKSFLKNGLGYEITELKDVRE